MNPGKIKVKWTQESIDDLKNQHGFLEKEKEKLKNMLHYEYKTTDKREIELIKEQTEIDFEDGGHFIYSMSKKQLRKIKLGAIDSIREFVRMKKIVFHSKVFQNVEKIMELKLSKEIRKSIDKEIINKLTNIANIANNSDLSTEEIKFKSK